MHKDGRDKTVYDRLEMIRQNPPIIHGGPGIDNLAVIDPNDPSRVLLKAYKSDPIYGYLFLNAFRPFGSGLNYVAVDLDKLADLRSLDPSFLYKK